MVRLCGSPTAAGRSTALPGSVGRWSGVYGPDDPGLRLRRAHPLGCVTADRGSRSRGGCDGRRTCWSPASHAAGQSGRHVGCRPRVPGIAGAPDQRRLQRRDRQRARSPGPYFPDRHLPDGPTLPRPRRLPGRGSPAWRGVVACLGGVAGPALQRAGGTSGHGRSRSWIPAAR